MTEVVDLRGRCACGAVRLKAHGFIVAMTECWCRDCQKETGGGATHSVIFPAESVEFEGGELGEYIRSSDRGARVVQRFCRTCANVLTADVEDVPFRAVRAGVFDDTTFFEPQMVLYHSAAPKWARFPENARLFETQPSAA
ncbi:GFA family protein [Consotaella salsifontis]|uniref:Uncharacterized conserved protein n=1 Tax=Consotaella salsifontis TaxID=1365950 RepID=A0A1T4LRJ7_9HYPH|nr:GFA family protein [Consotaella salsifontis]SJZ57267.1 Uncharacterized conserved protein [Consotaella salsifontis]